MIFALRDLFNSGVYHYKKGDIKWVMSTYMLIAHILGVYGIYEVRNCTKDTILWGYILIVYSAISVTAGNHRLWSHKSYEASLPMRIILMIGVSIANQGTILHWARDHRVHHKFSDTKADPHNANNGFFFSHMGWLFVEKHPLVKIKGSEIDMSDLKADPVVRFQSYLHPFITLYLCFVMPAQIPQYFWGEKFWPAFFVCGAMRYLITLHGTWLVNSAAHIYGDHPYDVASWPAENPFVSMLVMGEGWHNWHHKYPFDYAASEFGILSQFNPTKLTIDLCASLGLAKNLKTGTAAWTRGRARRAKDEAEGKSFPSTLKVEEKKVM
eukprot:CAMPEP_0118707102 /NCGR_PEP_ID=MMETSP0800-20121206/20982_1 /TAXON_ID=210618 ORGANISM="Striatella unipunctata, Strain CCMP2910" /NCGR_SAMPLE_ID=MMETSP0800 /ASSEMBLY_ACC=CAM_ASM_000638 /LENGTH=324 /DNA_ID=CAMNT_0006609821 /DNA_START=162 /DNA_END=1136 /DNA_ORIENTATION=+